jgi:uncharacterized protein YbaR (Trm112 family)
VDIRLLLLIIFFYFSIHFSTTEGYPLHLQPTTILIEDTYHTSHDDTQQQQCHWMVYKMLSKINYDALKQVYDEIQMEYMKHPDRVTIIIPTPTKQHQDGEHPDRSTSTSSNRFIFPPLPDVLPTDDELLDLLSSSLSTSPTQGQEEVAAYPSNDITATITTKPSSRRSTPTETNLFQLFHWLLFDLHIQEGILICPSTQRQFLIKDGIPNMILHEDEI